MTRVALVTGGARGIGKAIASDLSRDHGCAVTCLNSSPDDLSGDVLAIRADLTEDGAARDVIEQVMARFGRLDVIVNNAGQVAPSAVEEFDRGALHRILDVNMLAPQAILAAALPHLSAGASIISISSVNAVLPPMGAAFYGASKAALNTWTRGVAKELGPRGIRVNAVAPGAINIPEAPREAELTQKFVDLTALGRIGAPQDIANAVRFLASDAASFITGEVITVSGGYRL